MPVTDRSPRLRQFQHPLAFRAGAVACTAGVLLHLPTYLMGRDMGYRLAGMRPDAPMLVGMGLIVAGLLLALYGLVPRGAAAIRWQGQHIRVRALDDAPIRFQHVALLAVIGSVR